MNGEAAVAARARAEDEHGLDEALVAETQVEALEDARWIREVLRIAVEVVEEEDAAPFLHLPSERVGPVDVSKGHGADALPGISVQHREARPRREGDGDEADQLCSLPDVAQHEQGGEEASRDWGRLAVH